MSAIPYHNISREPWTTIPPEELRPHARHIAATLVLQSNHIAMRAHEFKKRHLPLGSWVRIEGEGGQGAHANAWITSHLEERPGMVGVTYCNGNEWYKAIDKLTVVTDVKQVPRSLRRRKLAFSRYWNMTVARGGRARLP